MRFSNLEEIKDEKLQSLLNDSSFIEMWQNRLNDKDAEGANMKITIINDDGQRIIYNTELDFIKKKGRIISKEIQKFFHKDK